MDPTVKECLDRDYPVVLFVQKGKDGTERYAAGLLDFPGCIAQGETRLEARERLEAIKPAFFARLVELGVTIPRVTSLPAVIPGVVGFYDPETGRNVVMHPAEGKSPQAEVADEDDMGTSVRVGAMA